MQSLRYYPHMRFFSLGKPETIIGLQFFSFFCTAELSQLKRRKTKKQKNLKNTRKNESVDAA